jgi:hypothetical protein
MIAATHDYFYFTSIHILAIGILTLAATILDSLARPNTAYWTAACLDVSIHLGALVGTWVTVYLLNQPCAIRVAAYKHSQSIVFVMVGHALQHAVLPFVIFACTPGTVPLRPKLIDMAIAVGAFVTYSAYGRPCQIYPVDDPKHRLWYITLLSVLAYGLLTSLWVGVHYTHPGRRSINSK